LAMKLAPTDYFPLKVSRNKTYRKLAAHSQSETGVKLWTGSES
jgi:hypothetical protein